MLYKKWLDTIWLYRKLQKWFLANDCRQIVYVQMSVYGMTAYKMTVHHKTIHQMTGDKMSVGKMTKAKMTL